MLTSRRIGLTVVGLVILGSSTVAEAQTQPGPGAGGWPGSNSTRAAYSAGTTPAAAATRHPASSSYNRVTTNTRRRSAYSSSRGATAGYGAGMSAEDDPFRPYSAQARRSAGAISPTRPTEAPPPPPREEPPAQHDYYPSLRGTRYPNANVPQMRRHCTPSRGSVMAGSLAAGGRPAR